MGQLISVEKKDNKVNKENETNEEIYNNEEGICYINSEYSFCLFCEKHTLIKDNVHCNFCDSCHHKHIYNCKRCSLYYETIELQKKYKKI